MPLSVSASQTQRQSQKLILTQTMRESLKLLQMPLPDLREEVENALLENPALESGEAEKEDGTAWNAVKQCFGDGVPRSAHRTDGPVDPFFALSQKTTFTDMLLEQLGELKIDRGTERICRYLIQDLDDRGYLGNSAESLAGRLRLPLAQMERALAVLHALYPPGVGAKNLRECLFLQVERKHPAGAETVKTIIGNYLELVAENKMRSIANRLGISIESAQKACDFIRHLNPIPSRGFDTGEPERFVIPEAAVVKNEQGTFSVFCNEIVLPRLSISKTCRQLLLEEQDPKTVAYLKEKMKQALDFLKGLSRRKSTLTLILEKIVEFQSDFFESGWDELKPMCIADIADSLGLHVSTVSRAVSGKYILCPFGTIRIKSLFSKRLPAQGGTGDLSVPQTKERIRVLVQREKKLQPLSDRSLALALQESGILISRRTVTKYREALQIPTAARRKIFGTKQDG